MRLYDKELIGETSRKEYWFTIENPEHNSVYTHEYNDATFRVSVKFSEIKNTGTNTSGLWAEEDETVSVLFRPYALYEFCIIDV